MKAHMRRSWSALVTLTALVAAAVLQLCSAWFWIVLVLLAVSAVGEAFVAPKARAWYLLRQADVTFTLRTALRGAVAVWAWAVERDDGTPGAALLAVLVVLGFACLASLSCSQLRKDYARPVRARHVPGTVITELKPSHVLLAAAEAVVYIAFLAAANGAALLGLVGGVLLGTLAVARPVRTVLASRHAYTSGARKPSLEAVQSFLDAGNADWVLHASGGADTAYQVDAWLPTLERLERPGLILLRDGALFDAIARTSLPVVSLPGSHDLLSLDLSAVSAALFPAHVGNSIHLMRLPHLRTAFIGHGDSDKSGSSNPYARAYDQIWVAGQAGADRYRRAGLALNDDALVQVGRPQVAAITTAMPETPTLLYAPTWEGWNQAQEYSSVLAIGPALIAAALEDPAGVRVIYKPHPLTGKRDPRYRQAHAQIVELIESANRRRGVAAPPLGPLDLSALDSAAAREDTLAEHYRRYFASLDPAAHLVVNGPEMPDLISCFNSASAMVSDVSSVISDFLASGKPYAVFNHAGDADLLRTEFPSTSAGIVLDDAQDIAPLLDVLAGRAHDQLVGARAELGGYLLGRARGDRTFQAALDSLIARR